MSVEIKNEYLCFYMPGTNYNDCYIPITALPQMFPHVDRLRTVPELEGFGELSHKIGYS